MSFKLSGLFPSNPVTTRGASTKISSFKDKVVYANGKTVIVSLTGSCSLFHPNALMHCVDKRFKCTSKKCPYLNRLLSSFHDKLLGIVYLNRFDNRNRQLAQQLI
jgi:hypothetical protein